jgi:hypothetical protein
MILTKVLTASRATLTVWEGHLQYLPLLTLTVVWDAMIWTIYMAAQDTLLLVINYTQ